MNESLTDLFIMGLSSGIYISISFFVGIYFLLSALRRRHTELDPFRFMVGVGLLVDCLSATIFAVPYVTRDHEILISISRMLDGLVSCIFLLAGYPLATGRFPSLVQSGMLLLPLSPIIFFYAYFDDALEVCTMVLIGMMLVYFISFYIRAVRHDESLKDMYSNLGYRTTFWYVYFCIWLIFIPLIYYFLYEEMYLGSWGILLYSVLMCSLYFYLHYHIFTRDRHHFGRLEEEEKLEEDTKREAAPVLRKELSERLLRDITRLMEQEEVYRNPDLRADALVRMLGTNTTYLYYFMRDVIKMRFYDYVNSFRIRAAKDRLANTDDTIESISLSCGFNSYNTFVAAFKRHNEVSPTEWRAQNATK